MPNFESRDPIPLLDPSQISYQETLSHSEAVDRWLGFRIPVTEKNLEQRGCLKQPSDHVASEQNLWFGLAEQILLTPYIEIRWILEGLSLSPGQTVVDLGAGYGRIGLVMKRCFPQSHFIGYEYVGERVNEARRVYGQWNLHRAEMIHADLFSKNFRPVEADIYFLYDYGTPEAIEKTLFDLKKISRTRAFKLIARGRNSRYIIESRHPWLTKVASAQGEGRTTMYFANPDLQIHSGEARALEI